MRGSSSPAPPCWIDGRLLPFEQAHVGVDDSAWLEGRGCYTTAHVRGGRTRWPERHLARLARDAAVLGLGPIDEHCVRAAFEELARTAFGDGDGAIRLQLTRDGGGRAHWVGIPRQLGQEPDAWRAIRAPLVHEGPQPWSGCKITGSLLYGLGREATSAAGVDEALFADREGRLIEGARSSLVVLADDHAADEDGGRLVTPDLQRGGVRSLSREVLLQRVPELRVRDIPFRALPRARAVIAINTLRGARLVTELDGQALASGPAATELAQRLDDVLRSEA